MNAYNFKVSYNGGFILFAVKAANEKLAKLKAEFFSALYFRMSGEFSVSTTERDNLPTINVHRPSNSFKGHFLWGGSERQQKVISHLEFGNANK